MELQKLKAKLVFLVSECEDEVLLNQVYRFFDLGTNVSFQLTKEEMNELDEMEFKHENGELEMISWEEVKAKLQERIKIKTQQSIK